MTHDPNSAIETVFADGMEQVRCVMFKLEILEGKRTTRLIKPTLQKMNSVLALTRSLYALIGPSFRRPYI